MVVAAAGDKVDADAGGKVNVGASLTTVPVRSASIAAGSKDSRISRSLQLGAGSGAACCAFHCSRQLRLWRMALCCLCLSLSQREMEAANSRSSILDQSIYLRRVLIAEAASSACLAHAIIERPRLGRE